MKSNTEPFDENRIEHSESPMSDAPFVPEQMESEEVAREWKYICDNLTPRTRERLEKLQAAGTPRELIDRAIKISRVLEPCGDDMWAFFSSNDPVQIEMIHTVSDYFIIIGNHSSVCP